MKTVVLISLGLVVIAAVLAVVMYGRRKPTETFSDDEDIATGKRPLAGYRKWDGYNSIDGGVIGVGIGGKAPYEVADKCNKLPNCVGFTMTRGNGVAYLVPAWGRKDPDAQGNALFKTYARRGTPKDVGTPTYTFRK